ncbi:hypothetical protein VNI00_017741 [Paramarasmius palmivorus]|uniref:Uncharacterized protein n=1 Tax=Paramarasmius palmivorus TaxID=297713 RepID=A0AAW0B6A5_9AGAR
MPRRKVYSNAEARRQAICRKSKQYYDRQREQILARRKAARKRQAAEHHAKEQEQRKALKEARERHQEEMHRRNLRQAAVHHQAHDPIWHIRRIENEMVAFLRCPKVSQYFDGILQKLLDWCGGEDSVLRTLSPAAEPTRVFKRLYEDAERYTELISREQGVSPPYQEASKIHMRLMRISDALESLENAAFDGTLKEQYNEGNLKCQQQLWRAAVDGITGAAAWTYSG